MSMVAVAITESDVRESVAVARALGEKFFEQIVWQVENEAWTILGYESWDGMREGEYGDMGVVAPRADRPELVARLRARGLTQQSIGNTLGISVGTVNADLKFNSENEDEKAPVTNSRGQERPASYTTKTKRTETESVEETMTVDADTGEVVDDEPLDGNTYSASKPRETKPVMTHEQAEQDNAEQLAIHFGRALVNLWGLTVPAHRAHVIEDWPRGKDAATPDAQEYATPETFRAIAVALDQLADEWEKTNG